MINISFYGSHNGAYAVEKDGKIDLVLEVERFINYKNAGIAQYKTPVAENILFYAKSIPEFLLNKYGISEFDTCYFQNTDVILGSTTYNLEKSIPAKKYVGKLHHEAHAAGTFYQSPYENALVFSFDGGGNDGKFNIYLANRDKGVSLIRQVLNPVYNHPHLHYDLGFPYMVFGHYLKDIRLESFGDGNLVYPGKLMGLASYGNVKQNWLPYFIQFYKNDPNGGNYEMWFKVLQENLNIENARHNEPLINFDIENRLEGQVAYDIAATSQRAFEDCFLEVAKPYIEQYPELPICITGGCGLNIILNTRIVNEFNKEVFVGPNPNDCGIAAGMLLSEIKPKDVADLTYSGLPLLDLDSLHTYINTTKASGKIIAKNLVSPFFEVADALIEGKIIGVARGRSEHGPRALGNRSILCNPSFENMKDILNAKVKNREWYRPFAPVVRLEDVNKYFEWTGDSRWMSFCPTVRPEWREQLIAITHVDGTARVQTVTKEQNEWLYDLLTEIESRTGVGVLLNTSFNVNGKPIASTLQDVFHLFETTQMDALIIENTYITKN